MIAALALSLILPLVTGYVLGRNQMDPDTPEGKAYYE